MFHAPTEAAPQFLYKLEIGFRLALVRVQDIKHLTMG